MTGLEFYERFLDELDHDPLLDGLMVSYQDAKNAAFRAAQLDVEKGKDTPQ